MSESEHSKDSVHPPAEDMFPGPWAAFLLCLAAIFSTSLFFALFETEFDFIAALGLGQTIGLGGVAALAIAAVCIFLRRRRGASGCSRRSLQGHRSMGSPFRRGKSGSSFVMIMTFSH